MRIAFNRSFRAPAGNVTIGHEGIDKAQTKGGRSPSIRAFCCQNTILATAQYLYAQTHAFYALISTA